MLGRMLVYLYINTISVFTDDMCILLLYFVATLVEGDQQREWQEMTIRDYHVRMGIFLQVVRTCTICTQNKLKLLVIFVVLVRSVGRRLRLLILNTNKARKGERVKRTAISCNIHGNLVLHVGSH